MSDIVNISIEVQDQIAVTIATVGVQGPPGPLTAEDLLSATADIDGGEASTTFDPDTIDGGGAA